MDDSVHSVMKKNELKNLGKHKIKMYNSQSVKLSSPSPKPSPPRPNANPKPEEVKNSKSYGTGGDTIITWATTPGGVPI